MFNPAPVTLILLLYLVGLFLTAVLVERRVRWRDRLSGHPLVYALALTVYCTSWTFYGSVGVAAHSGILFLSVYLGPALLFLFWRAIAGKLIHLRDQYHITSLADLVAVRYGQSRGLAAMTAAMVLVGLLPYIAVQFRSILSGFGVLTGAGHPGYIGPAVLVGFILLTIVLDARRLALTDRQPGLMFVIAVESVVKLAAFLTVGLYATYGLFDGFADIYTRSAALPAGGFSGNFFSQWIGSLLLAMFAVLLLPRQFYVTVVEQSNERQLSMAAWLVPLYFLVISLFVLPVMQAGLLQGLPATEADTWVLQLPVRTESPALALLVFLGGFSAASGMIILSALAISTMCANHLVLPLLRIVPGKEAAVRIPVVRWVVIAMFLSAGWLANRYVGDNFLLFDIGMLSFGLVFQFVPAVFGGLYWKGGTRIGAYAGLAAGSAVWLWTMAVPAAAQSGWLPVSLLSDGPLGIALLRPEHLFGVTMLDPLPHTVFWSLVLNGGGYLLGSLLFPRPVHEEHAAFYFVQARFPVEAYDGRLRRDRFIPVEEKRAEVERLFDALYDRPLAAGIARRIFKAVQLPEAGAISIVELALLHAEVQKTLNGLLGSTEARLMIERHIAYSNREHRALSDMYGNTLMRLRTTPVQFQQELDTQKTIREQLEGQADELKNTIAILNAEVQERTQAELALQQSEQRYRMLFESANDAIVLMDGLRFVDCNEKAAKLFGCHKPDLIGRTPVDFSPVLQHDGAPSAQKVRDFSEGALAGASQCFEWTITRKNGELLETEISLNRIEWRGERLVLAILRDITSRKRAESELRHLSVKRAELERIINRSPTLVLQWQPGSGWPVTYVSENIRTYGYTVDEFLTGRTGYSGLVHPDDRQKIMDAIAACMGGGPAEYQLEYRILTRTGDVRWVSDFTWGVRAAAGDVLYFQGLLQDITGRKQAETQLLQEQEQLRMLVNHNELLATVASRLNILESIETGGSELLTRISEIAGIEGIWLYRIQDDRKTAQAAACHCPTGLRSKLECISSTEYPELFDKVGQGRSWWSPDVAELPEAGMACFRSQSVKSLLALPLRIHQHFRGFMLFAQSRMRAWDPEMTFVLLAVADMFANTWERNLQSQARLDAEHRRVEAVQLAERASHLATLGTLTAGVTHEINQPLNAMRITVDGLLYWQRQQPLIDPQEFLNDLKFISEQIARIDQIIKHMRVLAHREPQKSAAPVRLNDVVENASSMLDQQLKAHGIAVHWQLEEPSPVVAGHKIQLEQVAINLLTNAMQALESLTAGSREIRIRTSGGAERCTLSVADNGPGIPEKDLENIFDPFFTTRCPGEGMGFGLSIVHNIVKTHQGTVTAVNNADGGACLTVALPAL